VKSDLRRRGWSSWLLSTTLVVTEFGRKSRYSIKVRL